MISIFIADDHEIVRQGLTRLVERDPDLEVVGEARTGADVLRAARGASWDVLVLDLSLPDQSGLEVLKQVKSVRSELPVLIMTMHSEEQFAVRALKSGASGYLTKGGPVDEIIEAIKKVARGEKFITEKVARELALHLDDDIDGDAHDRLSDREFEVFLLSAEGMKLAEIGDKLNLSTGTVSTYRNRIMRKIGVSSVGELVQYAFRHGFVE